MRDEIRHLIPEFDLITDAELRSRTLDCFAAAMEAGGWQPADLGRMPFTLLIEGRPASMLEHVRGVTRVCIESARVFADTYGERIPVRHDILVAGALLHDVGKFLEFEEVDGKFRKSRSGKLLRHPFSGLALAARHGLPDEVAHIIAVHSHEGDTSKRTPEAVILHHADFMNFETLK